MRLKELFELDDSAPDIIPQVKQDWKKGADAVNKILDPKQWFGGSSDNKDQKFAAPVEIRDSLNAASQNKIYQDDVKVLKQVIAGLQKGTYKTADPAFTIKAIRTAIAEQPLSKEQSQDLKTLAASF